MEIDAANAIKSFYPNPSLVWVYFEAIANSLDAGATEISVEIDIESFDKPDTLKIVISDNGAGFNDENFVRFRKLLTPRDDSHKGIGRLVFLRYFKTVQVDSKWSGKHRHFVWEKDFKGDSVVRDITGQNVNSTSLEFSGFIGERVKSYEDLKPSSLKLRLIDQFLPTLHMLKRNSVPFRVSISLNTAGPNEQMEFFSSDSSISSSDLPEMDVSSIRDDRLDAFESVDMRYCVRQSDGKGTLLIALGIDGRALPIKLIQPSAIPPGYSVVFLFESGLFISGTDASRQNLILAEGVDQQLLFELLLEEVRKVLNDKIPEISEGNARTCRQLEDTFPHLQGLFDERPVGIIDQDEAIEGAQKKFFKAQKAVLQCAELDDDNYAKSLDLSSRALTEYVLYREKIIERMRDMTEKDGESRIHNLIVPKYHEFQPHEIASDAYQNNAWLLDEKFMSFRTVLSEERMGKLISKILLTDEPEGEDGRPDISMIFSGNPDDPQEAVDVVVVEIKNKADDLKENLYAITQLMQRADKLAKHCPNLQRIWYYAVIQISKDLETNLRQTHWAPLFSMGKVYYQDFRTERSDGTIVPTPTFVVSYDAIVADASSRNHTFLEILKAGIKAHSNRN